MTPDELRSLADAKVRVELHTHRHTFPSDNRSLAEREIADNRAALKRWLLSETYHFCYPSGLWDERQWAWLDSMNVRSSTTCIPGLNSPDTPRHALRRFLDGEGYPSIGIRGRHKRIFRSFAHIPRNLIDRVLTSQNS